jgi:hypothetical protein
MMRNIMLVFQFAPNNYCIVKLSSGIDIWMSSVLDEMTVPHCVWKWKNFVWKWMFALYYSNLIINTLEKIIRPSPRSPATQPTATRVPNPRHRGITRPSPCVGLVGSRGHPNPLVGWFCCGSNSLFAWRCTKVPNMSSVTLRSRERQPRKLKPNRMSLEAGFLQPACARPTSIRATPRLGESQVAVSHPEFAAAFVHPSAFSCGSGTIICAQFFNSSRRAPDLGVARPCR